MEKSEITEGVNRELAALKDLLEEMAARPKLEDADISFCRRRLKSAEARLGKLRHQKLDHGKYSGVAVCQMLTRI